MKDQKTNTEDFIFVVLAWLVALALATMVFVKIKMLRF